MTPEEPLTRWEVRDMIYRAIETYDVKQDQRHRENATKLDAIQSALAAERGAKDYKQWILPIAITLILVIVTALQLLKK